MNSRTRWYHTMRGRVSAAGVDRDGRSASWFDGYHISEQPQNTKHRRKRNTSHRTVQQATKHTTCQTYMIHSNSIPPTSVTSITRLDVVRNTVYWRMSCREHSEQAQLTCQALPYHTIIPESQLCVLYTSHATTLVLGTTYFCRTHKVRQKKTSLCPTMICYQRTPHQTSANMIPPGSLP